MTLRELRLEKRLTQQELADKMECFREIIARHETGTRPPSIDYLEKYAKAYDIELWELLKKLR